MEFRRALNLERPSDRLNSAPELPLRRMLVGGRNGKLSKVSRLGPMFPFSSPEPSAVVGIDRTPTNTSVTDRSISPSSLLSSMSIGSAPPD